MDIEVIKKNYYFEKLTEIHELKDFDCGSVDLNDFIKNDALRDQKQNLNVTKLIMFEQKIIGFFSLVADSITIKQLNHEDGAVYKNKIKYNRDNVQSKNSPHGYHLRGLKKRIIAL